MAVGKALCVLKRADTDLQGQSEPAVQLLWAHVKGKMGQSVRVVWDETVARADQEVYDSVVVLGGHKLDEKKEQEDGNGLF